MVLVRDAVLAGSAGDGEHVASAEDEVLVAAVLHLGPAVLAVDHLVADGDVERDPVAVVVDATRADGQDLTLLRLLLGGVRDDQAGGRGLLGVEGLDDDPVLERLDVDRHGVDLHFPCLICSRSSWCSLRLTPSRGSSGFTSAGTLRGRVLTKT